MNTRQLILGAALALTLAATWWASTVDEGDDLLADGAGERMRPVSRSTSRSPAVSRQDLSPLAESRARFQTQAPPLFGRPAPMVAPVVRRAPPPPVTRAPTAPPVPFTYIGSLKEEGRRTLVFLLRGEELVSARVGRVIDNNYRVQSVDETGVNLVSLPLGLTQRIELADRS